MVIVNGDGESFRWVQNKLCAPQNVLRRERLLHQGKQSDFIQNIQWIIWSLRCSIRFHSYSDLFSSFSIWPILVSDSINRLIQSDRTTLTERVPFPHMYGITLPLLAPPKMSQFPQNAVRCHLLNPLPHRLFSYDSNSTHDLRRNNSTVNESLIRAACKVVPSSCGMTVGSV